MANAGRAEPTQRLQTAHGTAERRVPAISVPPPPATLAPRAPLPPIGPRDLPPAVLTSAAARHDVSPVSRDVRGATAAPAWTEPRDGTALQLAPEQPDAAPDIEWELSALNHLLGEDRTENANAGGPVPQRSGVHRRLLIAKHELSPSVRHLVGRAESIRQRFLATYAKCVHVLRTHVRARPLRALATSALAGFLLAWVLAPRAETHAVVEPTLKLTLRKLEPPPPPPVAAAPEALEEDPKAKPDVRQASALVSEGHGLRRAKRFSDAEARYRAALRVYPGYPRALSGLALLAIELGRGEDAVRFARALVKARPGPAANHRVLGDAYRAAGNLEDARRMWRFAAKRGDKEAKQRLRG